MVSVNASSTNTKDCGALRRRTHPAHRAGCPPGAGGYGGVDLAYRDLEPETMANVDICRAARTGPGYLDEAWEHGAPYED
jgi:hypothetical protein